MILHTCVRIQVWEPRAQVSVSRFQVLDYEQLEAGPCPEEELGNDMSAASGTQDAQGGLINFK